MARSIHLGISTCPNDTFAFHGLISRSVDWRGLDFRVELQDVEELNQGLLAGQFDVAKASFHAALLLTGDCLVLPSGSALGFGVGPLLLSRHPGLDPAAFAGPAAPRILCPGALTTATLLYKLFYPGVGEIQQVVFSEIMPGLQNARADFGVCIHEGRFTWQDSGLHCVADLGQLWETRFARPLPLGGILARRNLGSDTLARVQQVIRDSLEFGQAHPAETLPTMSRYAQEFSDDVLMAHVHLYVNSQTLDLGASGRQTLAHLWQLAVGADLVDPAARPLEVWS